MKGDFKFGWVLLILIFSLIFVACTNNQINESDATLEKNNVDSNADKDDLSLSEQFDYVNEKYKFAINIPADYNAQIFSDDTGILFTKWEPWTIILAKKKEVPKEYKVEIGIMPIENFDDFPDITAYVTSEYEGYSFEFSEYTNFSGFYVDEGVGDDAIRHFFTLSADGKIIYEAYLRVPSMYYSQYKDFFDDFVQQIVLL